MCYLKLWSEVFEAVSRYGVKAQLDESASQEESTHGARCGSDRKENRKKMGEWFQCVQKETVPRQLWDKGKLG